MDKYVIIYDRDEIDSLGEINKLYAQGYLLKHVVPGFQRQPGHCNFTQYIMEHQGKRPDPVCTDPQCCGDVDSASAAGGE